jgi:hypothetical protein
VSYRVRFRMRPTKWGHVNGTMLTRSATVCNACYHDGMHSEAAGAFTTKQVWAKVNATKGLSTNQKWTKYRAAAVVAIRHHLDEQHPGVIPERK